MVIYLIIFHSSFSRHHSVSLVMLPKSSTIFLFYSEKAIDLISQLSQLYVTVINYPIPLKLCSVELSTKFRLIQSKQVVFFSNHGTSWSLLLLIIILKLIFRCLCLMYLKLHLFRYMAGQLP